MIYIVLALLIILLPFFKKINKKTYCIIIGCAMTLIVGFRSIYMGMGDTEKVYVSLFDQLANMTFVESFKFINENDIEIVFYMLTRLYIGITTNVRIYLLLLAIPLNLAVSRCIYKYSKIPSLSFIMFFSLNYFAFSFTLLRHCIALAILIIAYDYLCEKNIKKFLITVFLAGLFHRTAWIFFIAYPFVYVKYSYKNMVAIGLSLIFSYTIGSEILKILVSVLNSEHFARYANPETNTLTFFVINLFILVFSLMVINKSKEKKNLNLLLNMQTLGICFSSCMIFLSEAFRISSFFSIYSIILLPNSIECIENKKAKIALSIMLYIIFIAYFFLFTMHNNEIYPYQIGGFIR